MAQEFGPNTSFKGDFERTINTRKGPVTLLAEAQVEGTTVRLSAIAVYGTGTIERASIFRDILTARTGLFQELAGLGFDTLEMEGIRVPNTSSSANPGYQIDRTIDLTPFR